MINKGRGFIFIALFGCLACTLLFFFPTLNTIGTRLIGPAEDNMYGLWNLWWVRRAFSESASPGEALRQLTFTRHIFFPEGTPLYFNTYSFFNMLLALALFPLFSLVTTYNVLILSTFVVSGLGAYALAHYFVNDKIAAFAAGYVFAFSPFHLAHAAHHLNIASIQFMPFLVLYFLKSVREGGKRNLLLAMFFFFLNALCDWYYFAFALLFLAGTYVYVAARQKKWLLGGLALNIVCTAGGTLILFLPWLVPMITLALEHPEVQLFGRGTYAADLAGFFIPDTFHWAARLPVIKNLNAVYANGIAWESTVYLGLVNMGLIVLAWGKISGHGMKFFWGMLAFLILSLGPKLHVLGEPWLVPLPYALLQELPLFSIGRAPARLVVFVYLFLAVLVAYALNAVRKDWAKKSWGRLAWAVLCLGIFLDFFRIESRANFVGAPPAYEMIQKAEPEKAAPFAVLDLPPRGPVNNKRYLMYQAIHGFPIVTGIASRKIGTSLIDRLEFVDLLKQREALIEHKVKYIVVHKMFITQPELKTLIENYRKLYPVFYLDDRAEVYKVYTTTEN